MHNTLIPLDPLVQMVYLSPFLFAGGYQRGIDDTEDLFSLRSSGL